MSADWTPQAAESWKLSLPCTRAEAEALAGDPAELAGIEPPPVLMTSEPDPARPEEWRLDAYLDRAPDDDLLARLRALVPSAAGIAPMIERIEDADWVTLSQGFLQPIRAGRFFVHTAAHADAVPRDAVALRIEAGRAFGTGHHETTTGCMEMLDRLAGEGRAFRDIADVGTGTGLLAFAARALWPDARIVASDIDPVSIEVTAENMVTNGVPHDAITLVAADGVDDPVIAAAAPYDLVLANILAGPLIALAPAFARVVAPGGTVLLAGLLANQADSVLRAYAAHGFALRTRRDRGDWPTLEIVQQA
jgi:ribosomal protein L11 methyltransferase